MLAASATSHRVVVVGAIVRRPLVRNRLRVVVRE